MPSFFNNRIVVISKPRPLNAFLLRFTTHNRIGCIPDWGRHSRCLQVQSNLIVPLLIPDERQQLCPYHMFDVKILIEDDNSFYIPRNNGISLFAPPASSRSMTIAKIQIRTNMEQYTWWNHNVFYFLRGNNRHDWYAAAFLVLVNWFAGAVHHA